MKPKTYDFEDGRTDRHDPKKFTQVSGKSGTCFHFFDIIHGAYRCAKCGVKPKRCKARIKPSA